MNRLFYCIILGWYLLMANTTFAQGNTQGQRKADEELLKQYFTQNHIAASKTPSGLYYVIKQQGSGATAKPGQEVTMNYTGMLLNGKAFDSNTDPKFHHVQPLTFVLGAGQVIRGWDIGIQLLNAGSTATFYIPSDLAYGPEGSGKVIPPNSILVFDVELTDIDE